MCAEIRLYVGVSSKALLSSPILPALLILSKSWYVVLNTEKIMFLTLSMKLHILIFAVSSAKGDRL